MDFIEARADYYGTPSTYSFYINPNYIIKLEFMGECEDSFGKVIDDHYIATVDLGNKVETVHKSIETGHKLLREGGIKI